VTPSGFRFGFPQKGPSESTDDLHCPCEQLRQSTCIVDLAPGGALAAYRLPTGLYLSVLTIFQHLRVYHSGKCRLTTHKTQLVVCYSLTYTIHTTDSSSGEDHRNRIDKQSRVTWSGLSYMVSYKITHQPHSLLIGGYYDFRIRSAMLPVGNSRLTAGRSSTHHHAA